MFVLIFTPDKFFNNLIGFVPARLGAKVAAVGD
jgi:cadmium resistance protein CadD (predicted permease)